MFTLYRKLEISCAHHLPDSESLITKKCLQPHGHNYIVEVTIKSLDLVDGMVIDFGKVKQVINEVDHKDLNQYLDNPTAENLAEYFYNKINEMMSNDHVSTEVKVWETKDTYVICSR